MKNLIFKALVICILTVFLHACGGSEATPEPVVNCVISSDSSSSGTVNNYVYNSNGTLNKVVSTWSSGGHTTNYTWNSNGTIQKMENVSYRMTYSYQNGYRSVLFQSGGPSVTTVSSMHMTGIDTVWRYDGSNPNPIQMFILKYQDGNVAEREFYADYTNTGMTYARTTTYTYDDKPNPYRDHPSDFFVIPNKNNVVKEEDSDGPVRNLTVKYNSKDHPSYLNSRHIKYECD